MSIRIHHDPNAPTASVELPIRQPLPDYDLEEIEKPTPRDVDPLLASQGFKDLLDEARSLFEREAEGHSLEIIQLTGAICQEGHTHRPGLWLVARETGAPATRPMSAAARAELARIADALRVALGLD